MPSQLKQSASMMWLEQRRQIEYQQHRKRVEEQLPCIDNKTPRNLTLTNKKALMDRERYKRIDSENKRLATNMALIMEKGGGIDNKEPWRSSNAAQDAERRRKREQQHIANENLRMLKRLQGTKPVYSAEKWALDREKNEEYVARMGRYTYDPANPYGRSNI